MSFLPRLTTAASRTPRLLAALCLGGALTLSAAPRTTQAAAGASVVVQTVAAENEYANVIKQIGGSYVSVLGIMSNPTVDPHTYESSTTDASAIARAQLVIQNGVGYDDFMGHLEAASPGPHRTIVDVGSLLGLKSGVNPHLWYNPPTMPRVAARIADVLSADDPADKATFHANLTTFVAALKPWTAALNALRQHYKGTPVAVTEPVFDYTLRAAGLTILTPPRFELTIQEGNDPSPQDAQTEATLLSQKKVKAFFYNQQAVEPVTSKLLGIARARHIPIVGVYETMPLSKTYQSWMLAEVMSIDRALGRGVSTERLQ